MPWCTVVDVANLTGAQVDEYRLVQAQGVIDLYSGTTEQAAAEIAARDLYYLRMAVAYQAPWMEAQVDVFTRVDVKSLDQDGVRLAYSHEDAPHLAHLARLALSQLSWRRPRSVSVRPPGSGARAAPPLDTRVVDREEEEWEPL